LLIGWEEIIPSDFFIYNGKKLTVIQTRFDKFSGIFTARIDNRNKIFRLEYDEDSEPFEVNLMSGDELFDKLSVTIPDSDDLDNKEFFMNQDIDRNIILELIRQGFIEESGKTSTAGDKATKSYKIII